MNLLEMREQQILKKAEARRLVNSAKKETRKLDEAEAEEFRKLVQEAKDLASKIAEEQRKLDEGEGTEEVKTNIKTKMKTEKRFNLLKAIQNRAEGRVQSEEITAVIDQGKEEMRHAGVTPEGDIIIPMENRADILAGTDTQGAEIVATSKSQILAPLREASVLNAAGANFVTGCVGDFSIPAYAGTTAAWKGEVVASADGAGAFSDVDFAPKRLTAHIDVSKRFLAQDSVDAEALLKQDIITAVIAKLEGTILGKANVSATQPLGHFYTAPAVNGAASWDNVVAIETAVDTLNALQGNLSYITNAGGRGVLKTTDRGTDTGKMLLEGSEMNGYPVHVTNHVAKELQTGTDEFGLIFANWNDLIIAQWSGIDLVVDPYTVATEGQVRLVVNAYFDAKFRRSASWKTGSVK